MQEFRIKIDSAEKAQIEVVPTSDGGVEIIVHYGSVQNYGSNQKEPSESPKKSFKFHGTQLSPDAIIEGIKEVARKEYQKPDADKEELKKFVKFYERKIQEDGWQGKFDFDRLYERWLSNKK